VRGRGGAARGVAQGLRGRCVAVVGQRVVQLTGAESSSRSRRSNLAGRPRDSGATYRPILVCGDDRPLTR